MPQEKSESPFGDDLTKSRSHQAASALANTSSRKARSSGVRFTFILYENQRRWIGLGWTTSLFSYERGPWTDEHLDPAPAKDEFELPEVETGTAKWRWMEGSEWRIERGDAKKHARSASKASQTGSMAGKGDSEGSDGGGWIYYDNRWEDGRAADGWGRYTRRRKWFRDAELVEVDDHEKPKTPPPKQANDKSDEEEEKIRKAREYAAGLTPKATTTTPINPTAQTSTQPISIPQTKATNSTSADLDGTSASASASLQSPSSKKSGWFRRGRSDSKSSSGKNTQLTQTSTRSRDDPEDDYRNKYREQDSRHRGFSVQEDVAMGLG